MIKPGEQFEISIDSILGGQSQATHFANAGQFRASLGIDPGQPINDGDTVYSTISSGLLRPSASEKISGTTITNAPLWMIKNPKDALLYVYDYAGSVYTINAAIDTVTALADGGTMTGAIGNGGTYYDNYIYFAKNTDVARYGPLNGVAAFTGTYWTVGLSKAALTHTTYPLDAQALAKYPNHPMVRHSDGRLYFGDVVGNQGTIHFIQTKKTAVEGDTDDGSTFNALDLGYGLYPTAIESYGSEIVIGLYEGTNQLLNQGNAKLAFWDGTTLSPDKIIFVEFPDQLITGLKNINGVLYVISGNINADGFRISRFVGGYNFEEVYSCETGQAPFPGAVDGDLNNLLVGSHTTVPGSDACIYSLGLQKNSLGGGLFNVMRSTSLSSAATCTSVCLGDNNSLNFNSPLLGWSAGATGATNGIDNQGTVYSNAPSIFWSQMYTVGSPVKIEEVKIPLVQVIGANMTLEASIYTDDGNTCTTLTATNTNYSGARRIVWRPNGLTSQNNFWLGLRWSGSSLLTVGLPIKIVVEAIDE